MAYRKTSLYHVPVVYKYVSNGELLYIGLSVDLPRRVYEHSADPLFRAGNTEVYYHVCTNVPQMKTMEQLLIAKHKPPLNIEHANEDYPWLHIEEPEWILYAGEEKAPRKHFPRKRYHCDICGYECLDVGNLQVFITMLSCESEGIQGGHKGQNISFCRDCMIEYVFPLIKSSIALQNSHFLRKEDIK